MITIAPENGLLTVILHLVVEKHNQQKAVNLLSEMVERVARHQPGFVSSSVHRSLDGQRVVSYSQWRSRAEYEAFTVHPEAMRYGARLFTLGKRDSHAYEVAFAADGGGANEAVPGDTVSAPQESNGHEEQQPVHDQEQG